MSVWNEVTAQPRAAHLVTELNYARDFAHLRVMMVVLGPAVLLWHVEMGCVIPDKLTDFILIINRFD